VRVEAEADEAEARADIDINLTIRIDRFAVRCGRWSEERESRRSLPLWEEDLGRMLRIACSCRVVLLLYIYTSADVCG
jgi:hypothetical protein